tara:strand:- start:51 stop:554 length:504 start_codon:yes stop_codon:yes gene_type:complete
MGQEYFINSQELESKVRNLLPSQGGLGAGQDLSATTQIVPIIDLTETAEGSNVRADLQTALSLTSITSYQIDNTTTTIANTTGYYRLFGGCTFDGAGSFTIQLTDGVTTKKCIELFGSTGRDKIQYDFVVFLKAGESVQGVSGAGNVTISGCSRQIADIDGNLVDPA